MNMFLLKKLEMYWKYCGKEVNLYLLFSTIFCYSYLLLDFHIKTGTRFSLRDKQLFVIGKVELTRVDFSNGPKKNYRFEPMDRLQVECPAHYSFPFFLVHKKSYVTIVQCL